MGADLRTTVLTCLMVVYASAVSAADLRRLPAPHLQNLAAAVELLEAQHCFEALDPVKEIAPIPEARLRQMIEAFEFRPVLAALDDAMRKEPC